MADPKEKPNPAAIDPTLDREQGLALQFEDPGLDEILEKMVADESSEGAVASEAVATPSLAEEVADAVQELVLDVSPSHPDDTHLESFGTITSLTAEINEDYDPLALQIEGTSLDSAMHVARAELADRMFSLLVVEKSFGDLVETILAALMKATSATAGSVFEMDYDTDEFFFRASVGGGDPERLKAFRVPSRQGIVGHVAESQQPLLIDDMDRDGRQLRAISVSTGFEIHTCLAFPIVVAGRLYGVVELFNKAGGAHFEKADVQLAEDGSRMAAKVLEVRFFAAELARRMR